MKKLDLSMALMMLCVTLISAGRIFAQDWPGWRGDGRGISPGKNLPLKWSEDEGVKWKTAIPGAGHSSPIVWGNRVLVTTAAAEDPNVETFRGGVYMGGDRQKPDASEYAYCVICLDADQGNVLWSKAIARQNPKTRRHTKNTYASETPVTDGKHVFASFGSAGLYCIDFEGNVIWQRDLGLMRLAIRSGAPSEMKAHRGGHPFCSRPAAAQSWSPMLHVTCGATMPPQANSCGSALAGQWYRFPHLLPPGGWCFSRPGTA